MKEETSPSTHVINTIKKDNLKNDFSSQILFLNSNLIIALLFTTILSMIESVSSATSQFENFDYLYFNINGLDVNLKKCKSAHNTFSIGFICSDIKQILVFSQEVFMKYTLISASNKDDTSNNSNDSNSDSTNDSTTDSASGGEEDLFNQDIHNYMSTLSVSSKNLYVQPFVDLVDIAADDYHIVVSSQHYYFIFPNSDFTEMKQILFPYFKENFTMSQLRIKENTIVSIAQTKSEGQTINYLYLFFFDPLIVTGNSDISLTYGYIRSLYQLPALYNNSPIINYDIGRCKTILMLSEDEVDYTEGEPMCVYLTDFAYYNSSDFTKKYSYMYIFKLIKDYFDFSYIQFSLVEKFRVPYSCGFKMHVDINYLLLGCPFYSLNSNSQPIGALMLVNSNNRDVFYKKKTITGTILSYKDTLSYYYFEDNSYIQNVKRPVTFGSDFLVSKSSENYYTISIPDMYSGRLYFFSLYIPSLTFTNKISIQDASAKYFLLDQNLIYGVGYSNPYIFSNSIFINLRVTKTLNEKITEYNRIPNNSQNNEDISNEETNSSVDNSYQYKETSYTNVISEVVINYNFLLYFQSEFYSELYETYDKVLYLDEDSKYNVFLVSRVCLNDYYYTNTSDYSKNYNYNGYSNSTDWKIFDYTISNNTNIPQTGDYDSSKNSLLYSYSNLVKKTFCIGCENSQYSFAWQTSYCIGCFNSNSFQYSSCSNYCKNKISTRQLIENTSFSNNFNSTMNNFFHTLRLLQEGDINNENIDYYNKTEYYSNYTTLYLNDRNYYSSQKIMNYDSFFGIECLSCQSYLSNYAEQNSLSVFTSNKVQSVQDPNSSFCGIKCVDTSKVYVSSNCTNIIEYSNNQNLYYTDITDSTNSDDFVTTECSSYLSCYECAYKGFSKCSWCNSDKLCVSNDKIDSCTDQILKILPAIKNTTSNLEYLKQCYDYYSDIDTSFCGNEIIVDEANGYYDIIPIKQYPLNDYSLKNEANPHYVNKENYKLIFPINSTNVGFDISNIQIANYFCYWSLKFKNLKSVVINFPLYRKYLASMVELIDVSNNKKISLTTLGDDIPYLTFQTREIEIYFVSSKSRVFANEQVLEFYFNVETISGLTKKEMTILTASIGGAVFILIIGICCYCYYQKKMMKIRVVKKLEAYKYKLEKEERINKYLINDEEKGKDNSKDNNINKHDKFSVGINIDENNNIINNNEFSNLNNPINPSSSNIDNKEKVLCVADNNEELDMDSYNKQINKFEEDSIYEKRNKVPSQVKSKLSNRSRFKTRIKEEIENNRLENINKNNDMAPSKLANRNKTSVGEEANWLSSVNFKSQFKNHLEKNNNEIKFEELDQDLIHHINIIRKKNKENEKQLRKLINSNFKQYEKKSK